MSWRGGCWKYAGPLKDLSPPEQFLLIMSSIPRLNEKIHLLMLMHQFEVHTCHPAREGRGPALLGRQVDGPEVGPARARQR